jgi:hypothetical protein
MFSHVPRFVQMKRYSLVLIVFVAFLSILPCLQAQQFEGFIDIKITIPDIAGETEESIQRFYIKLPRIRIELLDDYSDMVVLVDNSSQMSYTLDAQTKRYSEAAFSELVDEYHDDTEKTKIGFDLDRTGRTQMILDYEAELFEVRFKDTEQEMYDRIEVWVTNRMGTLFKDLIQGTQSANTLSVGWQTTISELGLFPLITRTFFENTILETTEVVRIQPEQLGSGLFEIPADYQLVDKR